MCMLSSTPRLLSFYFVHSVYTLITLFTPSGFSLYSNPRALPLTPYVFFFTLSLLCVHHASCLYFFQAAPFYVTSTRVYTLRSLMNTLPSPFDVGFFHLTYYSLYFFGVTLLLDVCSCLPSPTPFLLSSRSVFSVYSLPGFHSPYRPLLLSPPPSVGYCGRRN